MKIIVYGLSTCAKAFQQGALTWAVQLVRQGNATLLESFCTSIYQRCSQRMFNAA